MREYSPPTREVLTLTEVRVHLRQASDPTASPAYIEDAPDDSWVLAKITAARQAAEQFLGFPLADAVYVDVLSGFGEILHPAVDHVTGIQYLNISNQSVSVPVSSFVFDPFARRLYVDQEPALSSRAAPVRVFWRGYYGSTDSPRPAVPEAIKHALLLMLGHWYENREAQEMPIGAESLMRPYRICLGMA